MNIRPILERIIDGVVWPAKGFNEQNFISRKIQQSLDHEKYVVLSDITLPSNGGNTTVTQIDQIIISIYGIFCIKTKGNHNWIFGSRCENEWTQWIGNQEHLIDNPFFQNYSHIKAIELVLNNNNLGSTIKSLVALPEASHISIKGTDDVGDAYQIIDKIKSYNTVLYTNDEFYRMSQLFSSLNITNPAVLENHKNEIDALKKSSNRKVAQLMHS